LLTVILAALAPMIACTDLGTGARPVDPFVSFSNDIFPIFQTNCSGAGCHIGSAANGLSLSSYASLMSGTSANGPVVIPGNADESYLVLAIEGTIAPRMPYRRAPLPDTLIGLIRNWIDDGALDN
jgi:hypothetical protein